MLEELRVRDLALIEDVSLEFGAGMTALTGETGAGKTALVEALKLLLGERADSTMVRSGAAETVVEGRMLLEGEDVVVRRRVTSDGRSRCTLADEMASVSTLADRLGPLFDLHGQHEHQALLSPSTHVRYLDRAVGEPALGALERYRAAREAYDASRRELEQLELTLADAERQAEYLRFVVGDIGGASPTYGEDDELERRLPTLRYAERLSAAAAEAFGALRGDDGASDAIAKALLALQRVAGLDPALDEVATRLAEAQASVDDLGGTIRDYGAGVEHDPRALDEVQSRLATLAQLKKKYGPTLADVLRTMEDSERGLASIDSGDEALDTARASLCEREELLRGAAASLDSIRREAIPSFEEALTAAAEELAMAGARFSVSLTEQPFETWGPNGPSRVEFLYVPAPTEPARPLAKIASGGEISRVMLALKSVLGDADTTPILVFDEIDAGIGGMTAQAVGRRLAELSRVHQVLVVTHLAQVAAFAANHLIVEKSLEGGRAATSVRAVEGEDRVAEIARMLSGADSDASMAHARELLDGARSDVAGRND